MRSSFLCGVPFCVGLKGRDPGPKEYVSALEELIETGPTMIADRERAVAYVAGRLTSGSHSHLIREQGSGKLLVMSGDVSADRIHFYDFECRGYVSGHSFKGRLIIFHAHDNATTELVPAAPGRYTGYDLASQRWFAISVTGKNVSVTGMDESKEGRYFL